MFLTFLLLYYMFAAWLDFLRFQKTVAICFIFVLKGKIFQFSKNNGSLKIKNKYFFIMPSPTRGLFLRRKKVFRPTLFIFFIFFKLLIADFFLFLWEFFFNCKKKIRKFKNSLWRRQDKKVAKKYYRLHDILIKHNTCEKV